MREPFRSKTSRRRGSHFATALFEFGINAAASRALRWKFSMLPSDNKRSAVDWSRLQPPLASDVEGNASQLLGLCVSPCSTSTLARPIMYLASANCIAMVVQPRHQRPASVASASASRPCLAFIRAWLRTMRSIPCRTWLFEEHSFEREYFGQRPADAAPLGDRQLRPHGIGPAPEK